MALTEERIQELIDKSISESESRTEKRVASHVKEQIEVEVDKIGTLMLGAQTSLADLELKSAAVIKEVVNAESRVSSLLLEINNIKFAQDTVNKQIENYMPYLEGKTADTLNGIIASFNVLCCSTKRMSMRSRQR